MSNKKRIEELERRVRELEQRPVYLPVVIVQPPSEPLWPAPVYPPAQPWSPLTPMPRPFGEPWIIYGDGHIVVS